MTTPSPTQNVTRASKLAARIARIKTAIVLEERLSCNRPACVDGRRMNTLKQTLARFEKQAG